MKVRLCDMEIKRVHAPIGAYITERVERVSSQCRPKFRPASRYISQIAIRSYRTSLGLFTISFWKQPRQIKMPLYFEIGRAFSCMTQCTAKRPRAKLPDAMILRRDFHRRRYQQPPESAVLMRKWHRCRAGGDSQRCRLAISRRSIGMSCKTEC